MESKIKKSIVSSSWLLENLNDPKLIVLDGSYKTKSEELKIKGARFFDIQNNFSDQKSEYPNMLPTPEQFELECQNLGINKDSCVVVYDTQDIFSSPRVWWMFKIMGHQNVFVLDGGFPDWKENNFPTEKKETTIYSKGNFIANYQPEKVWGFEEVKKNLSKEEILIIDARSNVRFNGTTPETRGGLRSGHIPSSINIHYKELLKNGKFKSKEELEPIFKKINPKNKQLVYTCGSGVTACILLLAGEMVISNKTKVYDGSWTEWAQREKF
jgi:thiosulfate/3-mercaptopyruvate sulfurtransferase